ncbi:MAG: nucleotide exchange factor GrpE [Bacteroidales bacterium]|nr:nucleotide exchange factor GrpE [Bacteroidales bacterium]
MTGKEKREEAKNETANKKKHSTRPSEEAAEKETETGQEAGSQEAQKSPEEEQDNQKVLEEIKAIEEKSKELHDKYLRLSAEFDNYRKRTLKEKADMIKTASEDLLRKLIPFVDDVERGLSMVNNSQDINALKEGMNLIVNRFKDFMGQNGVREIEALHQEFNTDFHEAVTKVPAPEEGLKGKVVDVVEKGYILHDKVIRYPKVVVGE